MRKLFIAGMMTAALIGCGDDSNGGETDASTDSATTGGDSSTTGELTTQVENVGAKCADAKACKGGDAVECRMTTDLSLLSNFVAGAPSSIDYTGGYCTAACTDDVECGDGGGCLLGALAAMAGGGGGGALGGLDPSSVGLGPFCAKKCDTASDCRSDYVCASLQEVFMPPADADAGAGDDAGTDADAGTGGTGGVDFGAILGSLLGSETYCLPDVPVTLPEGGMDDGGTDDGGTDDGGTDDGGTDAGADGGDAG